MKKLVVISLFSFLFRGIAYGAFTDDDVKSIFQIGDVIEAQCPRDRCTLVAIGRSPAPFVAYLQTKILANSGYAFSVPISDFNHYKSLTPAEETKLYKHFDVFFPKEGIKNQVLVIDYVNSGLGLATGGYYIQKYLDERLGKDVAKVETLGITSEKEKQGIHFDINKLIVLNNDDRVATQMASTNEFKNVAEFGKFDLMNSPLIAKEPRPAYSKLKELFLLKIQEFVVSEMDNILLGKEYKEVQNPYFVKLEVRDQAFWQNHADLLATLKANARFMDPAAQQEAFIVMMNGGDHPGESDEDPEDAIFSSLITHLQYYHGDVAKLWHAIEDSVFPRFKKSFERWFYQAGYHPEEVGNPALVGCLAKAIFSHDPEMIKQCKAEIKTLHSSIKPKMWQNLAIGILRSCDLKLIKGTVSDVEAKFSLAELDHHLSQFAQCVGDESEIKEMIDVIRQAWTDKTE